MDETQKILEFMESAAVSKIREAYLTGYKEGIEAAIAAFGKKAKGTNVFAVPSLSEVPLAECPVGLFYAGDELCLKTEYGDNDGKIFAYIVSSGEFFWGDPPQTIESQRKSLVAPVYQHEVRDHP